MFSAALIAAVALAGFGRAAPPNILFIYTDDQAAWAVGASGNPDVHTPNLDRLFSEGAALANCFVTTPVCSPSRAGLIASRYGTEVDITDWINPRGGEHQVNEQDLGLDPNTPTWVRLLRDAGYQTGLVGKWHLGTRDEFHPSVFGYEHFTGFRAGGNKVENPAFEVDGEERTLEGLTVDLVTDFALSFLEGRDTAKPFLLSVHYREPHAPWQPVRPEDEAPYRDKQLQLPNPGFPDLDVEKVTNDLRQYLASVTSVDRNVGRILTALDELGLRDDTVVIFTSDHGYNVGHHGLLHKGNGGWITNATRGIPHHHPAKTRPNMFDTSLRVPAAVRWPGVIKAGSVVEQTVTNLDWFPALLAIADVEQPRDIGIHGRNFLPVLKGEDIPWDDSFYGEYSMHHYNNAGLRMWRTPEWKLVRDFIRPGQDELYHLAADPVETVNLIDAPEYAGIREQLNARLLQKMRALGDPLLPVSN